MKTNRVMTLGITELLPLLSDAARKEILELAERKHLELAGNPTLPKPEDILPEWHSEICRATKTITDHISITVLQHVKEHLAAMGDDDADFQSVCFWVKQYYLCKLDAHLASDAYTDAYDTDFLALINHGQDDKISEMTEKAAPAFLHRRLH